MLKDIGKVERPMFAHPENPWLIKADRDPIDGYRTKMRPRNHNVLLAESHSHVSNSTDPRCTFHDSIEHRLHIRRRAADDAEHLGRRRLMLKGLAQFCITVLDFLEQSHVFNRDHRLVCKSLQ